MKFQATGGVFIPIFCARLKSYLVWSSDREAEGLRSRAGPRKDYWCHRFHRRTHVPHEMVCMRRNRRNWNSDVRVTAGVKYSHLNFFCFYAGKTLMKLTWYRRRRPMWSVRRWSSLSMKRGLLGTRIPPKTRKKTRKTSTGRRGKDRVVLNFIVLSTGDLGDRRGGGAEASKTPSNLIVFWWIIIQFCFYLDKM